MQNKEEIRHKIQLITQEVDQQAIKEFQNRNNLMPTSLSLSLQDNSSAVSQNQPAKMDSALFEYEIKRNINELTT